MERVGCSSSRHKTIQPSIIKCPTVSPAGTLGCTAQPVTSKALSGGIFCWALMTLPGKSDFIAGVRSVQNRWRVYLMKSPLKIVRQDNAAWFSKSGTSAFLYFFIYRHNESKRRLKNVSVDSVFFLLEGGCIFTKVVLLTEFGPEEFVECQPCMPTLAWAAGILHVRKLEIVFV